VKCTYINVYIICIYVFTLRSTVKFDKWSKETTFIQKPCDMLHALAKILCYVKWRTISINTLVTYIWPAAKPEWQITLKTQVIVKRTARTALQFQRMKTLAVHCHCDVCSSPGEHSAGCRTSWVCLQLHVTVMTCNCVTIGGSKFPPTVNKHCQHQHNSIPKIPQEMWNTNNNSSCDIQGAASYVHHHGSLCS